MLAKKYRLPIQGVVGKSGRSIRGRYFLLKVFSSNLAFNRFGIIISKKVAKQSSKRNRIKRIIFDALRKFIFSQTPRKDYLFIISPKIQELKPEQIKEETETCLKSF